MNRYTLLLIGMLLTASIHAKDMHTLVLKTTKPQMHCSGCENKIKNNVRFAKGVKTIETDLESQTVTVRYDADKGKQADILKIMDKIGFEVEIISDKQEAPKPNTKTDK